MIKHNYAEHGRSMVEMMGYLAVVMSVMIAIGKIVSNVFDTHRYSTASTQLTELATAIVKAGAIDVNYSEIIEDINGANTMNLVPTSFRRAGNTIYHIFGGTVTVGCSLFTSSVENTCGGKRADQFTITFSGLSKKQCTELAIKNWQSHKYVDLFALKVNTDYWFWEAYGKGEGVSIPAEHYFPVKRSFLTGVEGESSAICKNNSNNVITWVFN